MTWRVGRKLGRTLYRDEQLVGMMDTVDLAENVVDAMNELDDAATRRLVLEELRKELLALRREWKTDGKRGKDWHEGVCDAIDALDAFKKRMVGE